MSKTCTGILLLVVALISFSCEQQVSSFQGDKEAVRLADQMFEAVGGKEAWCKLRSLYILAEHTEPQMTLPYLSEIWRGIDRYELVIEQQNDSFHVKGVMDHKGGTIRYYDKRDTIRILSEEQQKDWEFEHNHNVYVLMHKLGCNPQDYVVNLDEEGRLVFYKDSVYVTSFGLDTQYRPHKFFSPNPDGSVSGSIFTHWGTDEGLTHSAGGHPLDSNFIYRTQIWKPSELPLKESFGEDIFTID